MKDNSYLYLKKQNKKGNEFNLSKCDLCKRNLKVEKELLLLNVIINIIKNALIKKILCYLSKK